MYKKELTLLVLSLCEREVLPVGETSQSDRRGAVSG